MASGGRERRRRGVRRVEDLSRVSVDVCGLAQTRRKKRAGERALEYIGGRIGCEGPRPPRESCERRPSTPNDRPSFLQRSSATRPLSLKPLPSSSATADVFAPAHLPFLHCTRSLRAQSGRPTRASQNNAAGRGTKEGPCAFGPRRRHGVDNPPSDRLIRPLRTPPAPGTPSCPCPIHTTRAVSPPLFIPAPSQTPQICPLVAKRP